MKTHETITVDLTMTDAIVTFLSAQIRAALLEYSNESRFPTRSGDEMDDLIKSARERANKLIDIRLQYELIACNVTWEVK